jgi:hypothetical protein
MMGRLRHKGRKGMRQGRGHMRRVERSEKVFNVCLGGSTGLTKLYGHAEKMTGVCTM